MRACCSGAFVQFVFADWARSWHSAGAACVIGTLGNNGLAFAWAPTNVLLIRGQAVALTLL